MARIRCSLTEAQADATRLAEAYIADRPDRAQFGRGRTFPDALRSPSTASKHPLAWVVVFSPIPPSGTVIDGGELIVAVDLQSGTVELRAL